MENRTNEIKSRTNEKRRNALTASISNERVNTELLNRDEFCYITPFWSHGFRKANIQFCRKLQHLVSVEEYI